MAVDVLLGLQWGDEGKGKIVDVIAPRYNVIARFQGGPNAGHTLEFDGIKHVLHTIPSGVFHDDKINIIGNGVVIDPIVFTKEINGLHKIGVDVHARIVISRKAHLIVPTHRLLDAASEAAKGKDKIGSTLKGIGPAYMDKTGRNGLRVGDINAPDFQKKYDALVAKHKQILAQYDYKYDLTEFEPDWFEGVELLRTFKLINSEYVVNKYLDNRQGILAEGAQGSLLDIDFGSYPFVTSSNTTTAGACTGLGVAPQQIGEVYGVFKAYCTRVGSGPFPTELDDEVGQKMRDIGREYGATTGRPRRCGWLDLPALKYACMINGTTQLIMMKADVLDTFDTLKICTGYKFRGEVIDHMPYDICNELPEPVYVEMKGWQKDLTKVTTEAEFPEELKAYIKFIEDKMRLPITIVSLGPDRKQTIVR